MPSVATICDIIMQFIETPANFGITPSKSHTCHLDDIKQNPGRTDPNLLFF